MTAEQGANNPYTRGLAQFIAGLRYEAIPAEVVARAKLLILDGFGCGIFGSQPEHSRILIDTLVKLDQSTTCGVWGTRQRLSAPHAALANGHDGSRTTRLVRTNWIRTIGWSVRSIIAAVMLIAAVHT